jgi:predicted nuclease of restriction endonuclease-like (RecB) superfamily
MSKKAVQNNQEYIELLNAIKGRISSAKVNVTRAMSKELISLYWFIGSSIVQKQEEQGWGKSVVEQLSKDIVQTYPDYKGFSERNLWNMWRLDDEYKNSSNLQQLVAEIPWGHNLLIMEKVSEQKAREYYLKASAEMGWSRNVLLNQIKADAFGLSKKKKTHNFPQVLPEH